MDTWTSDQFVQVLLTPQTLVSKLIKRWRCPQEGRLEIIVHGGWRFAFLGAPEEHFVEQKGAIKEYFEVLQSRSRWKRNLAAWYLTCGDRERRTK